MGRNPRNSKWFSTPAAERAAKPHTFTLTDETMAKLDELAAAEAEGDRPSRSEVIARAVEDRYAAWKGRTNR